MHRRRRCRASVVVGEHASALGNPDATGYGFEILPLSLPDHPRTDVTLRVSGFFRAVFSAQMDLPAQALREVMALDQPTDPTPSPHKSTWNVKSCPMKESRSGKPNAQSVLAYSELPRAPEAPSYSPSQTKANGNRARIWRALVRGSRAYGGNGNGEVAAGHVFARRLKRTRRSCRAKTSRERDILDSDNYYRFESGMATEVEYFSETLCPTSNFGINLAQ